MFVVTGLGPSVDFGRGCWSRPDPTGEKRVGWPVLDPVLELDQVTAEQAFFDPARDLEFLTSAVGTRLVDELFAIWALEPEGVSRFRLDCCVLCRQEFVTLWAGTGCRQRPEPQELIRFNGDVLPCHCVYLYVTYYLKVYCLCS